MNFLLFSFARNWEMQYLEELLSEFAYKPVTVNLNENFNISGYFVNENYLSLRFVNFCETLHRLSNDFKFMEVVQVEIFLMS